MYIHRGNHEDYLLSKRYGFEQEVIAKYPTFASKLLRAFAALFCALPLGSIIDKKILVVHGVRNITTVLELRQQDIEHE